MTSTSIEQPTDACTMMNEQQLLRSMISTSIELNNAAITDLDSLDRLVEAHLLLSEASANLKQVMHVLQGFPASYIIHKKFQYQWQELLSPQNIGAIIKPSNQGITPFLFLQALSIHDNHAAAAKDEKDDESCYASSCVCPCSISWVISYNLALTAHLLGTYYGERGTAYLTEACRLYNTVRARIEAKKLLRTENCSILHMAVLNNKACVCLVYERNDLASDCMDEVRSVLLTIKGTLTMNGTRVSQLKHFMLNIKILKKRHNAAAA
jgi:hypothetical protein